ncbi:unnamed protein product [Ilex paraguariensis]|uniref:Uncharacterized protein n=1 Tax=Ilex paraguariensis TaxID=185542 RepID=A0ABC8QXS9_9AQUA
MLNRICLDSTGKRGSGLFQDLEVLFDVPRPDLHWSGLFSKASDLVNTALSDEFSNLPPLIRSDFLALSHHLLIRSAYLVPFEDSLSDVLSARYQPMLISYFSLIYSSQLKAYQSTHSLSRIPSAQSSLTAQATSSLDSNYQLNYNHLQLVFNAAHTSVALSN